MLIGKFFPLLTKWSWSIVIPTMPISMVMRWISISHVRRLPLLDNKCWLSENEVARAEAMMIANTDNQYLVPTSGGPLRGLIQDHVVAGVWMCNKSTYFTRDQYFQIIYGALRTENGYTGRTRIETLPPAIMKPKTLWTGKQLVSNAHSRLT